MQKALENLKDILTSKGLTLVGKNGEDIFTSNQRGVKPLLELIENGSFSCGIFADKVVGKSAALLYCVLNTKGVYALTVSKPALEVFLSRGVFIKYDLLVERIENRTKDGLCPIEQCVINEDNPLVALKLINDRLKNL